MRKYKFRKIDYIKRAIRIESILDFVHHLYEKESSNNEFWPSQRQQKKLWSSRMESSNMKSRSSFWWLSGLLVIAFIHGVSCECLPKDKEKEIK